MYEYHVHSLVRVVDGDTAIVVIDLGFDVLFQSSVRFAGIDTPETHTTDLEEKRLGLEAKVWVENALKAAKKIVIRTEKIDSDEKYGRILGHFFLDDQPTSLNESLVSMGLAWSYNGGTKTKDLSVLNQKRFEFKDHEYRNRSTPK